MWTPLEAWGAPRESLLGRLWEQRASATVQTAFAELMRCELDFDADGRLDAAFDPSFVQLALDEERERAYGLYMYPPAGGDVEQAPVVEVRWADAPFIEFAASSLEDWLRGGIATGKTRKGTRRAERAAALTRTLGLDRAGSPRARGPGATYWRDVLPTRAATKHLERSALWRWLLEQCPPPAEDLVAWERSWTAWWVSDVADRIGWDALFDFGLEAYRKLGWSVHARVLEEDRDAVQTSRSSREVELWALVHPPTRADVSAIMCGLAEGEHRSTEIVKHWSATYRWLRAEQDVELRRDRQCLGDALVSAALASETSPSGRARLGEALVAFEYDAGLERLTAMPGLEATLRELAKLRLDHQGEQQAIAAANDWSDVDF